MNEVDFVARREPDWQRLSKLLDVGEVKFKKLTGDEVLEIVKLYRGVSADLARVRTETGNIQLIEFLNNLVVRAYALLYRRKKKSPGDASKEILWTVASTVRRRKKAIWVSVAVFFMGVFFTAAVMRTRPDLENRFIDRKDPNVQGWLDGSFEERDAEQAVAMHAFYSANNPRVAMVNAALSVSTLGLLTAYITWQNGASVGSLGTLMEENGNLSHLLISVSPHGASEITGAIISGGAGFAIGGALIAPGRRKRGDALRIAGKDAFVLIALSMVMMLIAAPFEAYFSFNPRIPDPLKVAVGCIVLAGWIAFFTGYRRDFDGQEQEPTLTTDSLLG